MARPAERKLLGYRILGGENARLGIAPQSVKRANDTIRPITRRNQGVSLAQVLRELRAVTNGWVAYFGKAQLGYASLYERYQALTSA